MTDAERRLIFRFFAFLRVSELDVCRRVSIGQGNTTGTLRWREQWQPVLDSGKELCDGFATWIAKQDEDKERTP